MYSKERLHQSVGSEGLPLMMALAVPTHFDVDVLINREDGLVYNPEAQANRADATTMGRYSTCHRRNSTGLIFQDNDRQQDD